MQLTHSGSAKLCSQRGLSVVELLVGVTVGLFIVGGATKLMVDYLGSNRRLLLETRVNQDLRAAADLVVRDLRRTGYWQTSLSSFWVPDATGNGGSYVANNYRTIALSGAVPAGACPAVPFAATGSGTQLLFSYSKDADNAVDANTEQRGFKIEDDTLKAYNGGTWQALTDVASLKVSMVVCEYSSLVTLHETCSCLTRGTCVNADFLAGGMFFATRPRATVSQYVITLSATSATDPTVRRSLAESVRLPNDALAGTCPGV